MFRLRHLLIASVSLCLALSVLPSAGAAARCRTVVRHHRHHRICAARHRHRHRSTKRPTPTKPTSTTPTSTTPTSTTPTSTTPTVTTPTTTTPTGGLAATKVVYDNGGNLYEVNGLGQNPQQLTTGGSTSGMTQFIEPSLSVDGTRLVYQGYNSQVFVADPSNVVGTSRQLTNNSDDLPGMYPRISADGSQAIFTEIFYLQYGAQLTTYVQDINDSTEQSYDTTGGIAGFGPGGSQFCNNSNVFNQLTIGTGSQVPNNCTQIVANQSSNQNARFGIRPVFSPDGQYVAASYNDYPSDTTNGIYVYNAATGALVRQLTNTPGDDMPVFSPDGTEILFNRGNSIYEVPTAGGPAVQFVAQGNDPTWSR
jgi:Tol biopolymer transport system component